MVHQLIDAGINESHELDLADRLQPLRGHADAESADEEFGKRRIEHAFRSETLLQSDRRAEDTAVDPTSSPNTTTLGSSSIARARAKLMASTSVTSGISRSLRVPGAARHRPSA